METQQDNTQQEPREEAESYSEFDLLRPSISFDQYEGFDFIGF